MRNLCLRASVGSVKVRRIVIVEVHPDHDAEEAADLGHRANLLWVVAICPPD